MPCVHPYGSVGVEHSPNEAAMISESGEGAKGAGTVSTGIQKSPWEPTARPVDHSAQEESGASTTLERYRTEPRRTWTLARNRKRTALPIAPV